jgi:hypothetical protein
MTRRYVRYAVQMQAAVIRSHPCVLDSAIPWRNDEKCAIRSSSLKPQAYLCCIAYRLEIVLQALQDRALLKAALVAALFDQCLNELCEHLAAAQAAAVEVVVQLDHLAGHPELHELVHLVDQGNRSAAGRFQAQ